MVPIKLNEIREEYLRFFEKRDHLKLESFSLVPKNDESILIINSGMVPFKNYFDGTKKPPHGRLTTCQKCVRTIDIDNVGKTSRHASFFEMLGNFSFGDYFKKEAIEWAWEFVTETLKISKDKLWVSVYEEDKETVKIWKTLTDVHEKKIVFLGKKDNFWEIGTGPCGPCSEIYFDRGFQFGCKKQNCKPGCNCDRFIEFWNLVFTQFEKNKFGEYIKLNKPNIDTGMGLERIACIIQGKNSIFDINETKKILLEISNITKINYEKSEENDISLRIITDHIKSCVFLVSDSILPSNEGRGYVLRRLIRRAEKNGIMLGLNESFLYKIVNCVIQEYSFTYPELLEKKEYIKEIIKDEEEKFFKTLEIGIEILKNNIERVKNVNEETISAEIIFNLYDTYGFPFDLACEILEENGIKTDKTKFDSLMENQKNCARSAKNKKLKSFEDKKNLNLKEKTLFVGYDNFECDSQILSIYKNSENVKEAKENDKLSIILNKTVFYAESGGQVSDCGYLFSPNIKIKVLNVIKQNEIFILETEIEKGKIKVGDKLKCQININKRKEISKNHTCVHLLQSSLIKIFGNQIQQKGSYVSDEKFHFDFSYSKPINQEELEKIEKEINNKILENLDVYTIETDKELAKNMDAISIFDKKYKEKVRVVKIDDYSTEFCGGTHVKKTGEIGICKIISQRSVSNGVRRIEGISGLSVLNLLLVKEGVISEISEIFKIKDKKNIIKKIQNISEELKENKKEIKLLKTNLLEKLFLELSTKFEYINKIKTFFLQINKKYDTELLRNLCDLLTKNSDKVFVILSAKTDKNINIILLAISKNMIDVGISLEKISEDIIKITKGSGGGKSDFFQINYGDATKIQESFEIVKKILEKI